MKLSLAPITATALCAFSLLSACDDGSGSSVFADDDGPGGNANGALPGELVISLFRETDDYPKNTVLEVDLQSGRYAELSGNASLDANGLRRREVSLRLEKDRSRPSGMIGTAGDCSEQLDGVTCVLFMDGEARVESVFIVRTEFTSRAKRSRDGRFIALMSTDSGLEMYDLDGQRLAVNADVRYLGSGSGTPYDWTADGSILFARSVSPLVLARTRPHSIDVDSSIELPAAYEGQIEEIAVSLTGERAVLTLDGDRELNGAIRYRRPVVLDLESLSLYEPLSVEFGESMDAQSVQWSPDGQWLLFKRNWNIPDVNGLDALNGLPYSPLYAVRADGGSYAVPSDPSGSTDKIRMIVMGPESGSDGALDPRNLTGAPSFWRE